MNPWKIVSFTLLVLTPLFVLSLMSENGKIAILGYKINYPSFNNSFFPRKEKQPDISKFISKIDTSEIKRRPKIDSTTAISEPFDFQSQVFSTIEPSAFPFEFAENNKNTLFSFFSTLNGLQQANAKITILHYGDSQIEGDRITGFFRNRLQSYFGGSGPGTIPTVNVYETNSFIQRISENFIRYTAFGGKRLKSANYGMMASAGRFTKENRSKDTISSNRKTKAWIEIQPNPMALERSKEFSQVHLFYGECRQFCQVNIFNDETLIHSGTLISDNNFHTLSFEFEKTPNKIRFEFEAVSSPTIYGISLEGAFGIQVDNIAMRGSSGDWVGKSNGNLLRKMYESKQVGLIIMQYGGNQIPSLNDRESVKRFGLIFKSQIAKLKQIYPKSALIVVGPSDMSYFRNGIYQSYPYLEQTIKELKQVTFSCNGVYWDLYAAMGGQNSMPQWVKKGLAGNDYIHFSSKGSKIAGQLFTEAFLTEFDIWKKEAKNIK